MRVQVVTAVADVLAAAQLFDRPPTEIGAAAFLTAPGHHLLVATVDGHPAGFVSAVRMVHPDKNPELFVYELGVEERFRRRGIASALLTGLAALAVQVGATALWTATEPDNLPALGTYAKAGAVLESGVVATWPVTDESGCSAAARPDEG